VLEYLEGETLAQRLLKGSLPVEQVLQYAIEISDALDKAHRKGVTHRDLKPGNIMLTKSGSKLLDFGLAKLPQDAAPATPLSQLPTANDAITAQGTILGTLQYMAPEQLEAKEADARTDIFAFGVVVYEMATGKKAFEGKSQASVISAIMSSDPQPISSLQPMTPSALDRVVKKCLAKEPEKRWQAASDVCDELKWIAEQGSQAAMPTPSVVRRKVREHVAWLLAAVALVVAVLATALPLFPQDSRGSTAGSLHDQPSRKRKVSRACPQTPTFSVYRRTAASWHLSLWTLQAIPRSGYAILDSQVAQPVPGTDDALETILVPG